MRRRDYLKTVAGTGTIALGGVAGCLGNSGSGDDDLVRFGLTAVEGDVDTREQWRPLFEYVENEADVTVEVN